MTKNEKKVLKCCNKYFRQQELIDSTTLLTRLKMDNNDLSLCLDHMNKNGYFEIYSKDICGGARFLLSYKAKRYKEFQSQELKSFLIKSVAIPIFVSIVTNLAITLLGLLLS